MAATDLITSFEKTHSNIQLLTPAHAEWSQRRSTRGQDGQQHKPLGIAIPDSAEDVASIVKWAKTNGVEITVRTGGNDFYGRNAVDGGLIIDMRDINSISISADKKTVTVGGGVITKDLIQALEKEDLVTPTGNAWIVGLVGWATLGGYGPLTNRFGMGFENIVDAQIVNGQGEVVQATEEMLEGIRGMGGNLGIVTSLTVKVYPAFKVSITTDGSVIDTDREKVLSGMVMLDCTLENIDAVAAAEQKFTIPKELTFHHFVLQLQSRVLGIMTTWASSDHDKGQKVIDDFIAHLPPVKMNTIASKSITEHFEAVPVHNAPWGAQRSIYIRDMTPSLARMFNEALKTLPEDVNMSWTGKVHIDHDTAPKNCFGVGSHCLLTFSDMVNKEESLEKAREWNDGVYKMFRESGDQAVLEGSYPPLARPGDRTPEQLFGEKLGRAKELKTKYDPEGVFKHAVPRMGG